MTIKTFLAQIFIAKMWSMITCIVQLPLQDLLFPPMQLLAWVQFFASVGYDEGPICELCHTKDSTKMHQWSERTIAWYNKKSSYCFKKIYLWKTHCNAIGAGIWRRQVFFFFVLHFLPTLFRFRYLKWPHIWCDFVLVLLYWIPCFNFSSFLLVNDQFLIIYSYDWRRWPLPSFLVLAILPLKRRETSIDMLNLWILTLSLVFISPIDIISSRSFRNSIIRTIGTWAVFIPMIDCLCCVSCKLPTSFQRMMLTDVVPGSANNPPQKSSALGCLHM